MEHVHLDVTALAEELKEIRAEQAKIDKQNREAVADSGKVNPDAEISSLRLEVKAQGVERRLESARRVAAEKIAPEHFGPNSALNRWVRAKLDGNRIEDHLSETEIDNHLKAADESGIQDNVGRFANVIPTEVQNAISPHDATGSPVVPVRVAELGVRYKYYGGVAQMAAQDTVQGESVRHPYDNADASLNAAAAPKNIASTTSAFTITPDRNLGAVTFLGKLGAAGRAITGSQARMSNFDMDRYVDRTNRRQIGRAWDQWLTRVARTGNTDPRGGAVNLCKVGHTAASATDLTLQDFISLAFSVDPAYWQYDFEGEDGFPVPGMGRIGWIVAPGTQRALANLAVDPQSSSRDQRKIWLTNVREAIPTTFLGFPLRVGSLEDPATKKLPAMFGDFSAYQIYNFGPDTMDVIRDTTTAGTDSYQIWNYTYRDGGVVSGINADTANVTEAFKSLQMA